MVQAHTLPAPSERSPYLTVHGKYTEGEWEGMMSRPFAVVLGICFLAAGVASGLFAFGKGGGYNAVVAPLFCVAGIACFFHRGGAGR